jgi:hypothetical protein
MFQLTLGLESFTVIKNAPIIYPSLDHQVKLWAEGELYGKDM